MLGRKSQQSLGAAPGVWVALCAIGAVAGCTGESSREPEPQAPIELETAETTLFHSASSPDPGSQISVD